MALFVEAVDRWSAQEAAPRERRGGTSDGLTLFDFSNPLELRVETIAPNIDPLDQAEERDVRGRVDIQGDADDITAELVRLFEERSEPKPIDGAVEDASNCPIR